MKIHPTLRAWLEALAILACMLLVIARPHPADETTAERTRMAETGAAPFALARHP